MARLVSRARVDLVSVDGCGRGSLRRTAGRGLRRGALVACTTTALVAAMATAPAVAAETDVEPEPPSLEDLYATVESGVLSVVASTCGGSGSGSAFLISPMEAVTAAHVVEGSVSVAVVDELTPVSGTVEGLDASRDIALIRLDRPVEGYNFTLAQSRAATRRVRGRDRLPARSRQVDHHRHRGRNWA